MINPNKKTKIPGNLIRKNLSPRANVSLYILIMCWVFRNTVLVRRLTQEQYTTVDSMAMIQIVIVIAILVILVSSPLTFLMQQIKKSSLKFYYIYLILAAASALWSVTFTFSLYRAIEVFALSSAVLYFCISTDTVDKAVKRVQFIVWATLLLTIIGTGRRIGFSLLLRDNGLGASAAMTACFFAVWLIAGHEKKNRRLSLQATLGVAIVLISISLGSWWSFWFGTSYGALFTRRKFLVIVIILIGVTLFPFIGTETRHDLLLRDKQIEDLDSMTGRKYLWKYYMMASQKRPLLGYGFATGSRTIGEAYTTNTHNSFFAILLSVGWLGICCWGLFITTLIWELIRYRHSSHPAWLACASALAAGALNSMSLGYFGDQWFPSTTIFIAFLGLHLVFLREAKKVGPTELKKSHRPTIRYKIRW